MKPPSNRSLLLAAAALWILLAAAIAWRLKGQAVDDFYIIYRYAWNLLAGQGLVFNPGERVFGVTEPGLALLLAPLALLTRLPLPWLGTLLTAAGLVAAALVLLAEAAGKGRRAEALVGGTLVVLSSFLWASQGGAAPLVLAVLLLAALLGERRPGLAGLLAGASVWLRPDSAVGVGLLGLFLRGERRRLPWRYGLVAAAVIAAGAGAAWAYYGEVLPQTLAAKHAMAEARPDAWAGSRFWARALVLVPRHAGPLWQAVTAVGLAGLVPLAASMGRAGRLLAANALALAVLYPLLGVPFFAWYAVPVAFAALYGLPFAAGAVARALTSRLGERARLAGPAAALALLLPLLGSLLPASMGWLLRYDWQDHLKTYRRAALWIRGHSGPEEAIAYVEIGVLAYYSERPVMDILGLVTPGSVPYVRARDLVGAFLAQPTPWVVHHTRGRMVPLLERRWFWRAYEEVARFPDEKGEGVLTLFRRRPGAVLPPAGAPGQRHRRLQLPRSDRGGSV